MNTSASASYTYTDFQGFSDLRRMARDEAPEAADAAARQFEALFIQMMLKSMREAMPVDEAAGGDQVKFYQEMFDQQIALEMAQGEGIGLRESLLRELGAPGVDGPAVDGSGVGGFAMPQRQPLSSMHGLDAGLRWRPEARAAVARAAELRSAIEPGAERARGAPATVGAGRAPGAAAPGERWQPASPQAFVQELWPHAQRAAGRLGIAPEVLLAQSALETGWGRHVIAAGNGASSHNLFGIKADGRWDGPRVQVNTLEYVDGIPEQQRAAFRAYDDPAQSFADYVDFLHQNPRYREALAQAPDAEGYLRGLQAAGYATDPAYADKILAILNGGTLGDTLSSIADDTRDGVAGFKSAAAAPTT